MKTATQSQMTQNVIIKRNQKQRKKTLKKICEKFDIIVNQSQVYYQNQEEFLPQQLLQKHGAEGNLQKCGIIVDESIIFDREQRNCLNQNNSSGKCREQVIKPNPSPLSHIAPPIDFGAAVLQVDSSNQNYGCGDSNDCQNNTESKIEKRICQQLSESKYIEWEQVQSEFFQQFRKCYEKHMKQIKNVLNKIKELMQINKKSCKDIALGLPGVAQLPSKARIEFPKLDQIESIQKLRKQKMPSQINKSNWIDPSLSINHQSEGCENIDLSANIRQQKSLSIIPTHLIKQDLSSRLTSNFIDSSIEQCSSGSNYLPQTKIEKVAIHQMQENQLLFYKSYHNYTKKSWPVLQCKNQEQFLKEVLFSPQANQPNQSAIQDKCKVTLKKFFDQNQPNSQNNILNIQELETLMIKSGSNKDVLDSSFSQRWTSEAEEENMKLKIKRTRMYSGCPFLVNVRSRKK